ncbi:MAG: hypothetical protein RL559_738, partial [Pseudomonadota bacterium]
VVYKSRKQKPRLAAATEINNSRLNTSNKIGG